LVIWGIGYEGVNYFWLKVHEAKPGQTEQTKADIAKDIVTEGAIKLGTIL
jgi:hypothetical protein